MKQNRFSVLAAGAMLIAGILTSCSKDDANALTGGQNGNYPADGMVRITTTLDEAQPVSRAATTYTGKDLSLSILYTHAQDKYTRINVRWNNNSGTWAQDLTADADPMLWKNATIPAYIVAYAPYVANVTDFPAVPFSVQADQSVEGALVASDLVGYYQMNFVPGSSLSTLNALNITFTHCLSKFSVNLTYGNQYPEGARPTVEKLEVTNVQTQAEYNTTTLTATAEGDLGNLKAAMVKADNYEAIVVPQVVSSSTKLVLITLSDGTKLSYTTPTGQYFDANKHYTLNLRIGKDKLEVVSITVENWQTGEPIADGDMEPAPYFADTNFEKILTEAPYNVPVNAKGNIDPKDPETKTALEAITELDVRYTQIHDLSGIEYLTNLTKLDCDSNHLTSLDLSKNKALEHLDCSNNPFTSLNLSENTKLKYLDCTQNQLTSLDLSKNIALTNLSCGYGGITSLNLSENIALTNLECSGNQLTSLDLSKNIALTELYCSGNQLTSLNLSNSTELLILDCGDNNLTTLNLSNSKKLTDLSCINNQLAALDLSENIKLTNLSCNNNKLSSLNLSNSSELLNLSCDENDLTTLNLYDSKKLTNLSCANNQLAALNLSNNIELTELRCNRNKLPSLNLSEKIKLTTLYCDMNQLTSLDLSKNTKLETLYCNNNRLATLDIRPLLLLDYLYCSDQTSDGTTPQQLKLTLTSAQNAKFTALGGTVDKVVTE